MIQKKLHLFGEELFLNCSHEQVLAAGGVVVVGAHNQASSLERCLQSISAQRDVSGRWITLVLDDQSEDNINDVLCGFANKVDLVWLQKKYGDAATVRNRMLDIVDSFFTGALWAARMDADDCFSTSGSLALAVDPIVSGGRLFVLGGNRLVKHGQLLDQVNRADHRLKSRQYVLERLQRMNEGDSEAELPSCNLVLRTNSGWRYPYGVSGEDHWLVARLLLEKSNEGEILQEPYYADYTLGGGATCANQQSGKHRASRRNLWAAAQTWGLT